jgi:2-succinyl-5-enolpyruvyl-6-hydroxy-3-cyclohexene-1-carboxylate synthase
MGSPLSATMADIYLQYIEEMFIKHRLETQETIFYRRYVDDILIISDTTKTNEHTIQNFMNSLHPFLLFTPTTEVENTITYLDLAIHRQNHTFQLSIHHKPTQIDATIHFKSNHPIQYKLAAYCYHINCTLTIPITESTKKPGMEPDMHYGQKQRFSFTHHSENQE